MDPDVKPDNGSSEYASTPFGSDAETTTHVQPTPAAPEGLPGEAQDPRYC